MRSGLAYTNRESVPQDQTEAFRWFRLSAEQGYDNAL